MRQDRSFAAEEAKTGKTTSARLDGRVKHGFGAGLNQFSGSTTKSTKLRLATGQGPAAMTNPSSRLRERRYFVGRFNSRPEFFIDPNVIRGHPACGKSTLKFSSAQNSVDRREAINCRDCVVLTIENEAGFPVLNDFWNGSLPVGDDWRATGHRLNRNQAEGFGPIYGK